MAIATIDDLLFDLNASDGINARVGGAPVFTRGSAGGYRTRYGIYHQMPADRPREEWRRVRAGWNLPEYDPYHGKAWCPTISLQPSRSNQLTRSNFSASWATFGGTLTANQRLAPDGTLTAATFFESTATDFHGIYRASPGGTINGAYCSGIIVKPINRQWCSIYTDTVGPGVQTSWFDVVNGVKGTQQHTNAGIEHLGDGWFWIWVATTANWTNTAFRFQGALANGGAGYTGSTANGYAVWGPQMEQAAFPTSHIPTPADAAVTRLADQLYYNEAPSYLEAHTFYSDFIFGQTEGSTIYNIGDASTRAQMFYSAGVWTMRSSNGGDLRDSTVSLAATHNDRIEVIGERLVSGGNISVRMHARKNGGAITSGAWSTTHLLNVTNWSGSSPDNNSVALFHSRPSNPYWLGGASVRQARIVRGTGHTMDDLAAIVVDHNRNLIRKAA